MSTATFRYDFGDIKTETATAFDLLGVLDLRDHYVKIETFGRKAGLRPATLWVGQFVDDTRHLAGAIQDPDADTLQAHGFADLTAYGLEHLLLKCPIDKTYFLSGTIAESGERGVRFNDSGDHGGLIFGNRSTLDPDSDIVFVFDTSGTKWSHLDIVRHILKYHANTRTIPQFKLSIFDEVLKNIEGIVDLFGLSVFAALTKLADHRRGLGWYVDSDGDKLEVDVRVFSVFDTDIVVDGTIQIPANRNQITQTFDADILVGDGRSPGLVIAENMNVSPGKVVVRSAPIITMFSVSLYDSNLVKGWTDATETTYKDGAKDESGYAALSTREKGHRNDAFRRKTDGTLYRHFVIPDPWNWRVGFNDPDLTPNVTIAFVPVDNQNGTYTFPPPASTPTNQYRANKRFLAQLPILRGWDYTVSPPVNLNNDAAVEPSFESSMVFAHTGTQITRAHYRIDKPPDKGLPVATVELSAFDMGLVLRTFPMLAHHFDLANWQITPPLTEPSADLSNPEWAIDYQLLVGTFAAQTDRRVTAVFDTRQTVENQTQLTIDLPDVQLWVAAPLTIIGVGVPFFKRIDPKNLVIRDDTQRLRVIFEFVKQWYGTPRRSLRVRVRQLQAYERGTLLLAVSAGGHQTQVNTVITSVAWDFVSQSTTIKTEHVELDFTRLLN